MTTTKRTAAVAATLAGSLLAASCVTEGEITGLDDDPTPALSAAIAGTGSSIIVMNGLDPEAFWHADVQDHLVDFLNETFKGMTGAAAAIGQTTAGRELMPYAARGALAKGESVDVFNGIFVLLGQKSYTVKGEYGMASDWLTRPLNRDEQEMNVTYWAASLNAKNLPAEIGVHAHYAPFDAPPPKDMKFFEGVYFVLWEGMYPRLHVAPSDMFNDMCGDVQVLVRGRCGNANPAACGLIGVNKPAESVCTFDVDGTPLECRVGTDVARFPMKVVGSTVTCEI